MENNNLNYLFYPKSVAVIGASKRKLSIGNQIVGNLLKTNYKGNIYPVNPKASEIEGLKAYNAISNIPQKVDLAQIVLKNTQVPNAILECAQNGVKVCIINAAGFKETGDEGIKLENQITSIAKDFNMRILGPNCQGVINTDPTINTYCNFTFTRPKKGYISILAQSGGIGEMINNRLCELDEGIRMYASCGNACDIKNYEILDYWKNDNETKVIIFHMEYIDDSKNFIKVAKEVTKTKPILALLAGRTQIGKKAVFLHTGNFSQATKDIKKIIYESGIIPVYSTQEACQAARAFTSFPIPKGNKVGIITNTGGAGIVSADVAIENGCIVEEIESSIQDKLKKNLHSQAVVKNPVDLIATADATHYEKTLNLLVSNNNIDSILINFVTPIFVDCIAVANKMIEIIKNAKKPIIPTIITEKNKWKTLLKMFKDANIPYYDYPEAAATALCQLTKYFDILKKNEK